MVNLQEFKVVHGNRVYNAVSLFNWRYGQNDEGETDFKKFESLDILVVNQDGYLEIISGEASEFQFLKIRKRVE